MRHRLTLAATGTLCAVLVATPLPAQLVVNARAGMITYAEGTASIVTSSRGTIRGRILQLLEGETLDSKTGLVEMQLSADVMVRVAKQTQLRMIRSALDDTELELVSGAAIIEVNRLEESGRLRIRVRGCVIELERRGVYRFDAMPAQLRVYSGGARVEGGPKAASVKSGKAMDLATHLSATFEKKDSDRFHEWAATRSFQLFNFSRETRRRTGQWVRQVGGTYRSDAYALEVRQQGRSVAVIPRR